MKICLICKTEYKRKLKSTYKEYEKSKYCSRECMGVNTSLRMKGNRYAKGGKGFTGNHSLETRQKLSEINKANPVNYWQGKKRSTETIQKMSNFARTRVGSSSPRWKKDRNTLAISDRQAGHRYRLWRESVSQRDEDTCRRADKDCCGKLEAHHIMPWKLFSTLRYDVGNGITLCHFHHPRGQKSEEQFAVEFVKRRDYELTFTG